MCVCIFRGEYIRVMSVCICTMFKKVRFFVNFVQSYMRKRISKQILGLLREEFVIGFKSHIGFLLYEAVFWTVYTIFSNIPSGPKYNNFSTNISFPTNHNTPLFTFPTYLHFLTNHNPFLFNSTYYLNNRVQL